MSTHLINNMAVEIDGDGPALLCIHGLGGSSNTWTPLMDAFSRFRVIRPDLPGSARSPLSGDALSIDTFVDALSKLLTELNIESVHIAAHSLGTIVAQHFAVKHGDRVRSLALFGPLTAPPEAGRPGIVARAESARSGLPAMQEIANAIVQGATSQQTKAQHPAILALVRESIMRQTPEGYAQSCLALAQAQAAELEQIKAPTLLLTGDQDGVASPTNVTAMASRIANSQTAVFDGCGHWTTYEKAPECIAALNTFYAEIS